MRIGLVSNFHGGLKQFVTTLSLELRTKGLDVEVLCPAHMRVGHSNPMNQDLRVHYGLPAIARLFSERFDLIHCNIASLALIPLIRRKLNRTPIVETFHGFPQWWVEPLTLDRMA